MNRRVECMVAVAAIVCLSSHIAPASEWPEFRGPTGDGISTATKVPVEWSTTENIAWKRELPGSGWSSPLIADGKIYLTAATGSADVGDVSLRAISVDAATGEILRDVEAIRPDPEAAKAMHQKNSLASATPIVDGNRFYVHFGHMGTAALDLEGHVLWQRTDLKYPPMHGTGSSPVLADGCLVFNCDGESEPFIAARDCETGEVQWKVPRVTTATKTFSFSTPAVINVDGQTQVISPGSGMVGAYDPADGREIWRVNYDEGFSVVPRPIFTGGRLYVDTGFMRATVLVIDPHGASGDVTNTGHVGWKYNRGVPTTPSLLVIDDRIYFVSDNGVATCLDANTGELKWTGRLGGGFSASPVYAEGRMYFTNEEGTTYVVRASDEFELLATNELGERALASPAVEDGAIYLRTQSHLWRIGE